MTARDRVSDVVILGSGPAGLVLAAHCAERGLATTCVAPVISQTWPQRFGTWSDELGGSFLSRCVETSWAAPCLFTGSGEQLLDRRYAKLDTALVQDTLLDRTLAAGVDLVDGRAEGLEHMNTGSTVLLQDGSTVSGRLVVDATGPGTFVRRPRNGNLAYQAAYGELIEVDEHPFDQGEMVFMDLRGVTGARPQDPPTFLYAMPLGRNHIFVEETSLISRPAVSQVALKSRLSRRLAAWRIRPKQTLEVEHCLIPMTLPLPSRTQRTLAFGMAASMVHPATGFQLARTVHRAPIVADAVAQQLGGSVDLDAAAHVIWQSIWPKDDVRCWELYNFGARFLTTLDQPRVETWFETFFALSVQDWGGFLSSTHSSSQLARVMTRMFAALDPQTQWDLMRATASRHGAPLLRAALAQ